MRATHQSYRTPGWEPTLTQVTQSDSRSAWRVPGMSHAARGSLALSGVFFRVRGSSGRNTLRPVLKKTESLRFQRNAAACSSRGSCSKTGPAPRGGFGLPREIREKLKSRVRLRRGSWRAPFRRGGGGFHSRETWASWTPPLEGPWFGSAGLPSPPLCGARTPLPPRPKPGAADGTAGAGGRRGEGWEAAIPGE